MPLLQVALIASVLALNTACSARHPLSGVIDPEAVGRFSFVAAIPGGQRLTGTIDVAPDTLIARATSAECRVSPAQAVREVLAYECSLPGSTGIQLLIDRRSPTRKSRWSAITEVVKQRDVCTEYRTWENGTRTCTRSMAEEYVERVRVEGALVVTR